MSRDSTQVSQPYNSTDTQSPSSRGLVEATFNDRPTQNPSCVPRRSRGSVPLIAPVVNWDHGTAGKAVAQRAVIPSLKLSPNSLAPRPLEVIVWKAVHPDAGYSLRVSKNVDLPQARFWISVDYPEPSLPHEGAAQGPTEMKYNRERSRNGGHSGVQ
ncbi:hypothetical protein Bbelb_357960 [Branchiostoma belcheri]|nr:hypothetical protein Bbelb_357960 [Branchiostoma belcheri]